MINFLLRLNNTPPYVCMYNTYIYTIDSFIHLPISRHLGCFYVFAIVNNATMNMEVQISLQHSVSISLGYIHRSGIVGSYGHSSFNFGGNFNKVFHNCLYQFTILPTVHSLFSASSCIIVWCFFFVFFFSMLIILSSMK